ncbi:hypothetical protein [Pseudomonas putida]|uniref:Uncharacterized protein n=1 Tax=Pseudomonas putida TaxID=303 RepID=A0A6I6XJ01_PSEPU|nr:hypothetical protein [Pseudomonas putida]QHG65700.2 hypothetical protein C2H86_15390 [Pseudomonas putida]
MYSPDRTIPLTAWMVVGLGFLALALSFSARAVMSIAMLAGLAAALIILLKEEREPAGTIQAQDA